MTAMRKLGAKPDRPRAARAREYQSYKAKIAPLPTSASLRGLVLSILDQGRLGSCVADASFQAFRMLAAASVLNDTWRRTGRFGFGGRLPKLGSRLWGYFYARVEDGTVDRDDGTSYASLFDAVLKLGFPVDDAWSFSDQNTGSPDDPFRRQPDAEVHRRAFDQIGQVEVEEVDLFSADPLHTLATVRSAIRDQHVPVGAWDVDTAFCEEAFDASKPVAPPAPAAVLGSHAMVVSGYDGDSFDICNSWGQKFGANGYCSFTGEYVARARAIWIVKAAPVLTEEA